MVHSRPKFLSWKNASRFTPWSLLENLGSRLREQWRDLQYLAAVSGTLLFLSAQPRRWGRTVREVFAGSFYSYGVESIRFVLVLAILAGISVVAQLGIWTGKVGQSQSLGPILVSVVARELAPLFANFVLIVRGGSAIATGLGIMQAGGEVRVLSGQGLEPLPYLVMPRVIALVLSAFCLSVIFVLASFGSGYVFGALAGPAHIEPGVFINSIFKAVRPFDSFGFLAKCLLPALLTGVICATEGLGVERGIMQVPAAAKRALARSLAALFIISAAVSLLTYL